MAINGLTCGRMQPQVETNSTSFPFAAVISIHVSSAVEHGFDLAPWLRYDYTRKLGVINGLQKQTTQHKIITYGRCTNSSTRSNASNCLIANLSHSHVRTVGALYQSNRFSLILLHIAHLQVIQKRFVTL